MYLSLFIHCYRVLASICITAQVCLVVGSKAAAWSCLAAGPLLPVSKRLH